MLSFWGILEQIPGGWGEVMDSASSVGKLEVFDFGFALSSEFFSKTYTFWAGLIGGCFLATSTHGTDQLVVQRLLSARTQAEGRLALLSSWVVIFCQFSLFLLIGVTLFVLYGQNGLQTPDPLDRLYPSFVWEFLPPVVAGIVVASILAAAMSNISAALNSLASATVVDLILPIWASDYPTDAARLRLSRRVTLLWGAVLLVIAIMARQWGSVLEAGLAIASVPLGALLGVFSLGVLTKRVSERSATIGMAGGLVTILYVTFLTETAWTWYVVVGAMTTFVCGLLISAVLDREVDVR